MTTYSSSTPMSLVSEAASSLLQHDVLTSERKESSAAMFSGRTTLGGVLVIDDESDVRKVVRMTLEKAGYFVVEAENGREAIKAMNEGEHPMVPGCHHYRLADATD